MIAKNKQRISITVDKSLLETFRIAAEEWGLSLSEYLVSLAREDLTIGLTAQARNRSGREGE